MSLWLARWTSDLGEINSKSESSCISCVPFFFFFSRIFPSYRFIMIIICNDSELIDSNFPLKTKPSSGCVSFGGRTVQTPQFPPLKLFSEIAVTDQHWCTE
ncbi:hypothetical protein CDAR_402181 [Caerostris darwini]|uniref:Uncharacterized protein n=1 Tax=Caerostris darwini TaxID=1538125 RepID=A0AAV4T214_9ARAC|nr:hypothetical protein CDAR_402181 [Caerostris darwini]